MSGKLLSAIVLSLTLFAAGCGAEEFIDCTDICTDVEACVGDEFGVRDCRDKCVDQSQNAIDQCDACLDSSDSCGACLVECAPLGLMILADEG